MVNAFTKRINVKIFFNAIAMINISNNSLSNARFSSIFDVFNANEF